MKYFWFGHEEILVKRPTDKQWNVFEPNKQTDNYDEPGWLPVRQVKNGNKFYFDNFSEKVGLSNDRDIQIITTDLLEEMLKLAETTKAVFFMPPNQMSYIKDVVKDMTVAPLAIMPELCLLDPDAQELVHKLNDNTTENYYVTDWSNPTRVISRSSDKKLIEPVKNVPAPVLMPASALINHKPEILGRFTADKKLEFYEAELTLPQQAKQGRIEPGIGLVWVWGWGKKLWQWALPYTTVNIIDAQSVFKLIQEDNLKLRLKIQEKEKKKSIDSLSFDLAAPVIEWVSKTAREWEDDNV